jgi:hypothetical protein
MATTTLTFTPAARSFPYSGLVLPQFDRPRAEISFLLTNEAVAAAGVGDDRILQVICLLPPNSGYVLAETFCEISTDTVDTINTWHENARYTIRNATMASNETQAAHLLCRGNTETDMGKVQGQGALKLYDCPPAKMVFKEQPNLGEQVRAVFEVSNPTDAGGAGTINFFSRFYQFDVEQTLHTAVNSPLLTR